MPLLDVISQVVAGLGISSGNGQTPDINVVPWRNVVLDVNLKSFAGVTPSVTFTVQRKLRDNSGYVTLGTSPALTANGVYQFAVGPGMTIGTFTGNFLRIGWVLGGVSVSSGAIDVDIWADEGTTNVRTWNEWQTNKC